MKAKKRLCILIMALVTLSCAVTGKKTAAPQNGKTAPVNSYPEHVSASFYYTEGLKYALMDSSADHAVRLFRKVLSIDPEHAPTYYELAGLVQHPDSALAYSLKANELDTANVWYRTQLGRLMIRTERYDSALTIYNTLLKLAPNNPENYRLLAALYEQQQQPFAAITILDSAENRFGIMEGISDFKRQLLVDVKLYDRALREAKTIADNFPYNEANFVSLAELYAATGKDSLAKDAYDKALEINPQSIQTLVSLNEYYKRKNDNANFLRTAQKLFENDGMSLDIKIRFFKDLTRSQDFYRDNFIQINNLASLLAAKYPRDFEVMELYAQHLIASGEIEQALLLYKSHAEDSVPRREVFNYILDIEAYLKRPDSVTKYSTLALQAFADDPQLYLRKGSALSYFMKDYKGAENEFRKALKYAETDSLKSLIYGTLGDNSHSMGDEKSAFRYYRKGLQYDTTNAVIYNNYAYYLSLRGQQLELAEEMAEKANRLSPNNPTYLDTYAWVLYMLGRYEEAKAPMRQAVSLDNTGSTELLVHYGDILYKLNDPFMASVYWNKAKEQGHDPAEIEKRLEQIEE